MGDEVLLLLGLQVILASFLCTWVRWRRVASNEENTAESRARRPADDCPICQDDLKLAAETNCGHWFCAPCLISYWRRLADQRPVPCPCCRRAVTILFSALTPEEESSQQGAECAADLLEYNRVCARSY